LISVPTPFHATGQEVRWNFIHGLLELAIYGGRVDNPFDINVMVSYLEQFFDQSILSPGAKNKRLGPLRLPTSTNIRVGPHAGISVLFSAAHLQDYFMCD